MKKIILIVIVAFFLVLLGTYISSKKPHPNIILFTIDTLRPDHLGLYGYKRNTSPNIDKVFREGLVFERAYSTEANTPPSVASILSGLLPQDHGVRLLYQLIDPKIKLLPNFLPKIYQTAAFASSLVLTNEAMGLAPYFDTYDDFVDQKEPYRKNYERNAEATTNSILSWLTQKRDPKKPFFIFAHYIDPHGPYHPPASWKFSFKHKKPQPIDIERVPKYQREPGISDGLTYIDRYDEEIKYMDFHLGRLFDYLESENLLDDMLVIFTADHGESMMEHEQWFTHGYHVYEEIIRVPLLIKTPSTKKKNIKGPVSLVDIAPTILEHVGRPVPPTMHGINLIRGPYHSNRLVFSEATTFNSQIRAVIGAKNKWIAGLKNFTPGIESKFRFHLKEDPKELNRLKWENTSNGAERELLELITKDEDLKAWNKRVRRGKWLNAPKVAPRASKEALEKLKSLGYVQ